MEPDKKITFAFNRSSKKSVLKNKVVEEKKELIDCLEGRSIKIKDAVVVVEEPLVIPIKDNKRNLLDRVRESKEKATKKENSESGDTRPDCELTIDELAARELLKDAKKRLAGEESANTKVHVLPLNQENLSLEGEKEPTLEDYENIPISDYGLAMLRGMGWKDGSGIGKSAGKVMPVVVPELRPKGLGLGASRLVKSETPNGPVCDRNGQALTLKKGAHAKIIAGLHKGSYCEVLGLDDEGGRVIVKTCFKREILTLNEFLVVPVTKEEYSRGSKILNIVKYEEFKDRENKTVKEEIDDKPPRFKSNRNEGKWKSRHEQDSRFDDKKKAKTKYDEDPSSSSESDQERRRNRRKDKRRHRDKSRSPRRDKTGSIKKTDKSRTESVRKNKR